MKLLNKLFIGAAVVATAATMSSCTGDLDLVSSDPNTTTSGTFAPLLGKAI